MLACQLNRYDAVSNYIRHLANELSGNFEVSIFAFHVDPDFMSKGTRSVDVLYYTDRREHSLHEEVKASLNSAQLASTLAGYDLVIIVTERPVVPLIVWLRKSRKNVKLVWDFHGITPPQFYSSVRRRIIETFRLGLMRFALRYCDHCIVHSNYMRLEIVKYFPRDISVVPFGINLNEFTNADRARIRAKYALQDTFVLLYVGRMSRHKRVAFLLEGLAKLHDPSTKLLVVGDGEDRMSLETYAQSLGVADKALFLGNVSDSELPAVYSASDLFVTASLHEGVCVPILEAFASGKPALVPNLTAMPETADGGGLLYKWDSINDLVIKISRLKSDKTLQTRLSRKGAEIVKNYDITNECKRYTTCIEQILQG